MKAKETITLCWMCGKAIEEGDTCKYAYPEFDREDETKPEFFHLDCYETLKETQRANYEANG